MNSYSTPGTASAGAVRRIFPLCCFPGSTAILPGSPIFQPGSRRSTAGAASTGAAEPFQTLHGICTVPPGLTVKRLIGRLKLRSSSVPAITLRAVNSGSFRTVT